MLFRGLSFEKTEDLLGSEAGVGTSGGTYGQAPVGVEAASGRRALREEDGLCIGQPDGGIASDRGSGWGAVAAAVAAEGVESAQNQPILNLRY